MRLQGKVINWNDDKGFGFVEPNGGGDRAFVHIKAFNPRSRRPLEGELIIYELVHENNNRYKATNIKFASENKVENKRPFVKKLNSAGKGNNKLIGFVFTILFFIGLFMAIVNGKVPVLIGFGYLIISLITILIYSKDKHSAQNNRWRTPESTLHMLSLFGGWPGAMFAQKALRHKISKSEFISTYRMTVFLNIAALLVIYTDLGQQLFHYLLLLISNR